jgi:epsilon-lactone hydrolase
MEGDAYADGIAFGPRVIPWPRSISPEARASLQAMARIRPEPLPDRADLDGWRARIAAMDAGLARVAEQGLDPTVTIESMDMAGVAVHVARPQGHDPDDSRLYIDLHGGGLVFGGGAFCRAGAARMASLHGVAALAIDYRMPPDHPYPVPLDDCVSVYRQLVAERGAHNLIVGGASAGAYFAAALALRARDEGVPLPAALLLLTPKLDMTESGDSFETMMGLDTVLTTRLTEPIALYCGDHPLDHPYLSPLFGDPTGFPPTLVQSGTRDLYLSNAARMHRLLRDAGVDAELHVFEAMPHGRFFAGPEDAALDREIARFVKRHWRVRP